MNQSQKDLRDLVIEMAAEREGRSILRLKFVFGKKSGKKGCGSWHGAARREKVPVYKAR
jgi:hypothetical protein